MRRIKLFICWLVCLTQIFNTLVTALEANEDIPKVEVFTER